MRDLFGYRWAFRCTTDSSSDTVLGQGWAAEGYTAADIDPLARGVGWLLSETGVPRRIKAAYLTDDDIKYLAAYAARLRGKDRRMTALHALNGHDGPSPPARPAGPDTVKTPLTPNRAGRVGENDEYAAFARRILRAYARRVADGDVEALTLMLGLAAEIDTAIGQAVTGLRASATPGPRSAPGSASPARPPSNAGATPHDRRDSRPRSRTPHHGLGTGAAADDTGTTGPDFRAWERHSPRRAPAPHPIRLRSRTDMIDLATGELAPLYEQRRGECRVRQPPRSRLPGLAMYKRDARELAAPGSRAARASPTRSPRIRACSPPSPLPRSGRCTPGGCAARPCFPADPVATRAPATARTAGTSAVRPATSRPIPGSGSPCAPTATTTNPPCCSTCTRPTCGAVGVLPAPPLARLAGNTRTFRALVRIRYVKVADTRPAASSTSTP